MDRKLIKLSKEELNEVLDLISEDNEVYGLILKLVYIYGRNIGEVLKLKVSDVDLKHNSIDFNLPTENVSFMIHGDIKKDLLDIINGSEEYVFLDGSSDVNSRTINMYSNNLNRYLRDFIKRINKSKGFFWSCPILVCSDFKRLRGQHLFLDGADIHTINSLFHIKSIQTLKIVINYDSLLKIRFPCNNINKVFHEFTDLKLFKDSNYISNDIFIIESGQGNIYIELDYINFNFSILESDDKILIKQVYDLVDEELISELSLFSSGNFKFFGDYKIIKL